MANNQSNAAPRQNPVRTVFAPYFRSRYQNFQNIISNADFYTSMPAAWVAYQTAYVRQWDEWSRGFVLSLHRRDFFSVGMGKTVVDILTRECMKGGYRFDGENEDSTRFVTNWAKETHFDDVVQNGFANANRLGNNILRLNVVAGSGSVYPTTHPVNRTYFEANRRGEIVRARFIDMLYGGTAGKDEYYTVEDRIWYGGKPYNKIAVYKFTGTASYNAWTQCRDYSKLDATVQARFADIYGKIEIARWYVLPFKSLGCYNWQNTSTSAAINAMTGFSDSSLHTALDILYSIDYNWSMGQLDQYFGRTRVLIEKSQAPATRPVLHNGNTMGEVLAQIEEAPLESDVFTEVPSSIMSDRPAEPKFIQPDLRGEARKYIRDADLELLAAKVGLSSSTLANHLNYNRSKTATEVDTEKDTTDITVENKRTLANRAIDALLKDLCAFYGLEGDVDITWNLSGKGNKEDVLSEYRNGLMPLDECVKRLHPELTEAEVEQWVSKLQMNQQRQQQAANLDDIFGLGDEH